MSDKAIRYAMLSVFALAALGLGIGRRLLASRAIDEAGAGEEAVAQCNELVAGFAAYPLVWLGEDYDGLPLTGCDHVATPVLRAPDGSIFEPASDYFNFYYGTCTPAPGNESCPVPLQITIDPPCGPALSADVKSGSIVVRGATAFVKNDGGIRIEDGSVRVSIFVSASTEAETTEKAKDVAERLVGANTLASSLTRGSELRFDAAGDPGCD